MVRSDHDALWQVLMVTPSGLVEVVEVRAPNEKTALDTAQSWKPYHRLAMDPDGNPLINDDRVRPSPGESSTST